MPLYARATLKNYFIKKHNDNGFFIFWFIIILGHRPWKCELCPPNHRGFRASQHLTHHMKNIHNIQRTKFGKDRIVMYLSGMHDRVFNTNTHSESGTETSDHTDVKGITEEDNVITQEWEEYSGDSIDKMTVKQENYGFRLQDPPSGYIAYNEEFPSDSQNLTTEHVLPGDTRYLMDEAKTIGDNGQVM